MQSAPLRPVRLLALHGYPGSFGCAAEVDPLLALSEAMRDQGFALSIVAPRAPTAADSTGNPRVEEGVAWIAGDQTSAGKVVGFGRRDLMSDPHTTAPPFSPDELPVLTEEDNVWHGAVGFDASLRLLELASTCIRCTRLGTPRRGRTRPSTACSASRKAHSPPPSSSPSCSSNTAHLRRTLAPSRLHLSGGPSATIGARAGRTRRRRASPSFAAASGGHGPPRLGATGRRRSRALCRRRALARHFRDTLPARPARPHAPTRIQGVRCGPLRRSLHVIGERDTVVAPCRSEELLAAFVGPSVHRHDLVGEPAAMGGHVVPWDEPFYVSVAALLAGAVT
mmetsp:Transcript_33169/g.106666  ORF Transcript_33169/g.106666 Transcript_33169/m.106666 type:complete len:338 (+) Transcript_33169:38-1051(+)